MRVRGRPPRGGHLFNPPTHRHEKGCLTASTVLRLKFSKKFHPFHKATPSLFHACPFKKNSKKNFIYFPEGFIIFYIYIFLLYFYLVIITR